MTETIDQETAFEIYWNDPIAVQDISKHRWYNEQLVVFEKDGKLMGFYYFDPASELQKDQERFEDDPVPIFPVVGQETITTIYSPIND